MEYNLFYPKKGVRSFGFSPFLRFFTLVYCIPKKYSLILVLINKIYNKKMMETCHLMRMNVLQIHTIERENFYFFLTISIHLKVSHECATLGATFA